MNLQKEMREEFSEEVVRIEGNLLYLQGYDYPHKGIPTVEALERVEILKDNILKPWIVWSHPLPEVPTAFAKEFWKLHTRLAYILEYDQAYRFRIQDLLCETSKEKLLNQPIKELRKLLTINKERDHPNVHKKFKLLFTLLIVLLLFPPFRAQYKKRLKTVDYQNLLMDSNDIYWASHKKDYKYFGLSYEERQRSI